MTYFFLACLLGAKCRLYGLLYRRPFLFGQRTNSKGFVVAQYRKIPLSLSCLLCGFLRHHEAAFKYAWERWLVAGNPKEPGDIVELAGALFGRFTSDSSKRNYRCEIRLGLETGPAVFWILEILLSVDVSSRERWQSTVELFMFLRLCTKLLKKTKNFWKFKTCTKMERIAPWICGGSLLWYPKSQDCCNKLPKLVWLNNRNRLFHGSEG